MFTKNFKSKLKSIADSTIKYCPLIGIAAAVIGFGYKYTFGPYNNIENQLEEIRLIATSNQQMSLKNTIWNENIPLEDRTTACDIYLSLGYNSYTKKYCETIIDKGVSDGIFSYVIEESEVNKNVGINTIKPFRNNNSFIWNTSNILGYSY